MTDDQRTAVLKELANTITNQVLDGLMFAIRCCPNCAHWQEAAEQCANTVNCPQGPARPPANIIAHGCPQFLPGMPA